MNTIDGDAEEERQRSHNVSRGAFRSYAARLALVFILYLAAGKLGLSVPFTSGNVSPVWPASGVALASVLLWGYEVWPAIALAAFLVNFLSPIPTLSGVGIALGNTSSALVGGYLMGRFAKDRPSFERLRDVLGLMSFGAAVAPMIAASVGVTTLLLTHVRAWSGFSTAWQVWWLGDAMGVLPGANRGSTLRMCEKRTFVFSNLKSGEGVEPIANLIIEKGGLAKNAA